MAVKPNTPAAPGDTPADAPAVPPAASQDAPSAPEGTSASPTVQDAPTAPPRGPGAVSKVKAKATTRRNRNRRKPGDPPGKPGRPSKAATGTPGAAPGAAPGASTASTAGNAKAKTAAQSHGLGALFLVSHAALSNVPGLEPMKLSPAEAQMLGDATAGVMSHYGVKLNPKTEAMVQLIGVAALVYAPRVVLIVANRRARRPAPPPPPPGRQASNVSPIRPPVPGMATGELAADALAGVAEDDDGVPVEFPTVPDGGRVDFGGVAP